MFNTSIKLTACAVSIAISISSSAVFAAGAHEGDHATGAIGAVGDANHVDRDVAIHMGEMFFSQSSIAVRKGETIRFSVTNVGEFVHEFNIATEAMHLGHAEEMMMMFDMGVLEVDSIDREKMAGSGMAHSDPNALLLAPGETGELIWTFSGDASLELSCNVPGHRESGMFGPITIIQ